MQMVVTEREDTMGEQLKLLESGWPEQRTKDVVTHTPEELLLREVLDYIDRSLALERVSVPPLQATLDARQKVVAVLEVVSDYSHMKARVDELEDELDDRNIRIEELEDKLARAGDPDDPDDPESIPF